MTILRVAAALAGAVVILTVLGSAVRTVVVPRGEDLRLNRFAFQSLRSVFEAIGRARRTDVRRDQSLARFAPLSLLLLAALWAVLTMGGFVLLFWGIGEEGWWHSISLSGSSFTTLGFVQPEDKGEALLSVAEAVIGLGLVALLISYLPTLYSLFGRRETEVRKLDVRAGSPPTALEMLSRFQRIGWIDQLADTWATWEDWFSEVEESHTSHPSLVFFRSQRPGSSWITCSGAVLDSAAITLAALDVPREPRASVTIRAGAMALRAIADVFGAPFDPDPAPNAPISIHREEFDLLLDELAAAGLPVVADRDQAWQDFAGWRVNYDEPLLALCALCDAPATPWSSDRSGRYGPPTLLRSAWEVGPADTPRSF